VLEKVILQGFIVVPEAELEVVKSELITHKRLTLKENGCLTFTVTPDEVNPHKFSVYEEFVNQAAFDNHQARVKSSKWGEVTKNVERHYQISGSENI
jgi:quinol monooxygenase YgiN